MGTYEWALTKPAPEHDIRLRRKKFETFEAAKKERRKRIRGLEKGNEDDKALAKILRRCKKGRRCWTAACPVCMRRFRIWLFGQESKSFLGQSELRIVTLIPDVGVVEPDKLFSLSVYKMQGMLRKQLRSAGLKDAAIIGGFEIDYDASLQRWIGHFHLIVGNSNKLARKHLRKRFYSNYEIINRPMKVQKVKNRAKQFSYCLKSYAKYKEKYIDDNGEEQKSPKERLPPPYANLALRFMGQFHPQKLVFMLGVKRGNGNKIRLLSR